MRKLFILFFAVLAYVDLSYGEIAEPEIVFNTGCHRCKEPQQGEQGPAGPQGPGGQQGLPGAPGPAGTQGPTGPGCFTGLSFLSVTSSISNNISAQNGNAFEAAPGTVVSSIGPAMTFDPVAGTVTFNSTGFFQATYGLSLDSPCISICVANGLGALQLVLSPGGPIAGSTMSTNGTGFFLGNSNSGMTPLSTIFQITTVPTTLSLVNPDTDPFFPVALDGTAGTNSLFLTIKQLF